MTTPEPDLIVFDAACIFCSGFARFISKHDTLHRFRFVTAQSQIGHDLYVAHGLNPADWSTNIVIVDAKAYTKLAAFTAAMRALGGPWKLFGVLDLVPRPIGNWFYDRVAKNRYAFGRRSCPIPDETLRNRILD